MKRLGASAAAALCVVGCGAAQLAAAVPPQPCRPSQLGMATGSTATLAAALRGG